MFLDMAQNIVAYDMTSWCLSSAGTYYFICVCSSSVPTVCTCLCAFVCSFTDFALDSPSNKA